MLNRRGVVALLATVMSVLFCSMSTAHAGPIGGGTPGLTDAAACQTKDASQFPFNFLCTRSGTDYSGEKIKIPGAVSSQGLSSDKLDFNSQLTQNGTVPVGVMPTIKHTSTLAVTSGIATGLPGQSDSKDTPSSKNSPVLVWYYVEAEGGQSRSSIDVGGQVTYSDASDGVIPCPGDGGSPTGKVYYSQDSPLYNPSNQGGVNCHTNGWAVYWYFPNGISASTYQKYFDYSDDPSVAGFSFSINFNNQYQNTPFCVRQQVSVGGGQRNAGELWPNAGSGGDDGKAVANRVAKASARHCYNMDALQKPTTTNQIPQGSLTLSCPSSYSIGDSTRVSDPNHPGGQLSYKIVHFGGGSIGQEFATPNSNVDDSGTTTGIGGGNLSSSIVPARTYKLIVKDPDNGKWYYVADASVPVKCGKTADQQCTSLDITNNGGGAAWNTRTHVQIYDSNNNLLIDDWINADGERDIYWYTPLGTDLWTYITREHSQVGKNDGWSTDGATTYVGGPHAGTYSASGSGGYTCYAPTCDLHIEGSGPPGVDDAIYAGTNYTVTGTIGNTNLTNQPEQRSIPGTAVHGSGKNGNGGGAYITRDYNLSLTVGGKEHDVDGRNEVPVGGALDVPNVQSGTAPGSGSITVSGYPDFYGRGAINKSVTCSKTFKVYNHFDISPHASVTNAGSSENPSEVDYATGGKSDNPDLNISTTQNSWLTSRDPTTGVESTVDSHSTSPTYGSPDDETYVKPIVNKIAGKKWCAHVTISPAHGDVGPDGVAINTSDETSADSTCLKLYNEPYDHFLGGDVSAGGGFTQADLKADGTKNPAAGTCSRNNAGIYTYFNNDSYPSGSGVQIGALSIDPKYGFMSAFLRTSDPSPASGLSFSNNSNVAGTGQGSDAGTGGAMDVAHCIYNYYDDLLDKPAVDTSPSPTASVSSMTAHSYKPSDGGDVTITGGTVPLRDPADTAHPGTTIYVKGNVHITGNIVFANSDSNYNSIEQVPSFYLIVSGGKITIDNNVTRLDGVYISQPDGSGNGGQISTCDTEDAPYLLNNCYNQLVVNGSFVAKKVNLLRSFGSLRNGLRNVGSDDNPYNSGTKTCSITSTTATTDKNDCAAEIFRFNPEIYLAQPNVTPKDGPTKGSFDYITSLAPIL